MNTTRRHFLRSAAATSATAAAAAHFLALPSSLLAASAAPRAAAPLRILILGGTGFIGPHTVHAALARGHHVSVFNRGITEQRIGELPDNVTKYLGNRDPNLHADETKDPDGNLLHPDSPKGLSQLTGKPFDAVIDNSGYYPRHVKASAELAAAANARLYIFISSISAYRDTDTPNLDESAPVATMPDPTVENMGPGSSFYGPLKALCEQAAQTAMPGKAAIVRPGYIVGPGDPTDRFTYWPVRIQRAGETLIPGSPNDPIQIIDARDLADFLITLAENNTPGVFNAVGPDSPAPWGNLINDCVAAAASDAKLTWVHADFLQQNSQPGDNFPIWIPPTGETAGFHRWQNARAKAAGLKFRPARDTIADLLAWFPAEIARRERVTAQMIADAEAAGRPRPNMPDPKLLRAGPRPDRESALLAAWHAAENTKAPGGS